MNYQKQITISSSEFNLLKEGKHLCINGVRKFINIKCIEINTDNFLIATVIQIGGIFTKSCAIRVFK